MAVKSLKKKRKGLAYTLVAVILVVVSVLLFSIQSGFRLRDETLVVETRIATINEFMKDIQKDLARGMTIASHRSLLAILEVETSSGAFVEDSKAAFAEAFFNGTVNGTQRSIMQNSSFINWTQRIKTEAEKIGIDVGFEIYNLSIEHSSPWDLEINSTVGINAVDKQGTASWAITKKISAPISIKGFEDPLYIIKTSGRVPNVVTETDVSFTSAGNLIRHINSSFYIASAAAPSYLMRLEGDLGSSPYGIESVVNLNELTQQDLQTLARSNVDYIYFGSQSHTHCIINETLSSPDFNWFRLDSGAEPLYHLNDYNVHCEQQ